jgi:hypothetical protein
VARETNSVTAHESFEPDARRARVLDERMRLRLAESLEHVSERSRGIIAFDENALSLLVAKLTKDVPAICRPG